ncbi:MAG: hypothetical protein KGZ83_04190 [Sulfuricella sp.]|nr:hypothetical protein [Sulfuricella sp.]
MRYVSSLPAIGEAPEPAQPAATYSAHAVNPVRARAFPAQIADYFPLHRSTETTHEETTALAEPEENRRMGDERRSYCRRVTSTDPLLETRSSMERRRKNRRQGEPATAVDEEI